WSLPPEPGGARRSLSFLTEDGTDGSVILELPEDGDGVGPLSSTRRSLLEGLELGGGCGSGEPPSLFIPSLTPRPPGGSSLPPQPLASSTLLSAGDELGEGPRNAQGSPGSSPMVLLVPGDRGCPQDPLSDARGSPGSSPTVLLVPGDHGHPQDSPSDAQGSLHATHSPKPRVLEGGSGWQDPSTLGAHQPRLPHGGFGRLLAPWPPGSTAVEPRSPAVPLSPAGNTRCSGEHLEDEEWGQAPTGRHSPGTAATTSLEDAVVQDGRACGVPPRPLSDEGLRRQLRLLGDNPGPLVAALRTGHVPDCAQDELALARQFDRPDRSRHWREGLLKSSFNYLLLDPRTTQNLPLRSHRLSPAECFRTFVEAIFYVGKGTRARPYCHLAEALSQQRAGTQKTVTNQRKGNCYGVAASWPASRRRRLGVHMLHRAMRIFLAEGERHLRPPDIQGRR
ncbi:ANKL1 protein, partial [Chroicocephalus maculipennis]|nr:ANKL1 protein [Chroicocephalus maculipennis]